MAYAPFPTTNIDEGLQRPKAVGKAPKSRLSKPEDAYSIAATLVRAAIPRIERGRMVRGLLDGNPPRSPSKLRAAAQDWRANFNTLEGRSIASNAKTPYYDLFSASMPLVNYDPDTDDSRRDEWGRGGAEEFHRFIYGYASFESTFWQMLDDFVVFNKGFFWWPNPVDPYFKRLEWWRVMFPNGTGIDPDDWNMFAVRQYFTVTKLWELSNGGQAPGWYGDGVLAAISRARPLQPTSQQAQGIEIQQMLKDCDVVLSARSEVIKVVSIFTREYDGKWSWCMVEEDAALQVLPEQASSDDEKPRFLFRRDRFFDDPRCILCPFIYEAEEGSINAFTGLGKYLFQMLRSKDIIEMGLLDGVILRQYPLLQPQDAGAAQRASLMQVGAAHVLAPGVNVIQTNLLADLDGSLAVVEHLDRMVESNTAIFKPRMEKPRGNPETATGAQLRFQNATILTNSAVNRFYTQGDHWIKEVWKRATGELTESSNRPGVKAAREFQKRCTERGIPLSVLRKTPCDLSLTRVIGNGSPVARQQAVGALTPLVPEMGPRGRRSFFTDYVSAYAGAGKVERYFPKADMLDKPTEQDWVVQQENALMRDDGVAPVITDGQDNRTHIRLHVSAMQAAMQSSQQGADPVHVLTFIPVAEQHTLHHLQNLPKPEQAGWMSALQEIHAAYEQLGAAYQQQQEQAAKQQQKAQQMSADQQLKMMEIQMDAQRKDAKGQAQMSQRADKHQFDKTLADAQAAAGIQRETAQTAASIAQQQAKTEADIETQRIKAEAQAQAVKNKPKPKA